MKKMFSLALALIMALALAVPAMAATDPAPVGDGFDITVQNANVGETYKLYRIFDAVTDSTGTKFNYTIAANSVWKDLLDGYEFAPVDGEEKIDVFTFQAIAGNPDKLTVRYSNDFATAERAGADLAAVLKANIAAVGATPIAEITAGADKVVTFEDLTLGYYFVSTSTGALCSIDTNTGDVTISEKNTYPELTKEISADGQSYGSEAITAYVGDTVYYELTLTVPATVEEAVSPVYVHDQYEDGLTLNAESFAAVDNYGVTVPFEKNVATEGEFTLTFSPLYVVDRTITITYTAELDKDAEIVDETDDAADGMNTPGANTNQAWVEYSAFESTPSAVDVLTYELSIIKVDGADNAPLEGVEFELYDGETLLKVIEDEETDGLYRIADDTQVAEAVTTLVTPATGIIEIEGLEGNKTYTMKETKALDGYNVLATDPTYEIEDENSICAAPTGENGTGGSNVIVNNTGAILPSTGGMGTTLFYIVGGVMAAGAAILLVTKKKLANQE